MSPFFIKTRIAIQKAVQAVRAKAYEGPRHPWTFEQIPNKVLADGISVPNPRKQAAIFVVHGMGTQHFAETAVTLRDGIEDTIDALLKKNSEADIPPPYMAEGFWANFEEFQAQFDDEWRSFNDMERTFYQKLWESRTQNGFRTYFWFLRQLLRLCTEPKIVYEVGPRRWIGYVGMLPTGFLAFTVLLIRYPGILKHILGDVRLYATPRGFIEAAIVQRIDRRVGEQFLQLLGLDWEFDHLPAHEQLQIGGKPFRFKYITWVAHSLGTVVSYNVISDLLTRCEDFRNQNKKLKAVKRVEIALHRFITIGSPLEKFALLFRGALKPWPEQYAEEFLQSDRRTWWTNFFHVWDPVSGVLRDDKLFKPYVQNFHSKVWRIPLWAHIAYWHDIPILTYVLSRLYGRDVVDAEPKFKTSTEVQALRLVSSLVALAFFVVVVWGLVFVICYPELVWDWYKALKLHI